MDELFNPRAVAVIGATPKEGKVGNTLLKNLSKFKGKLYAVNPHYKEVLGVKCYPSVEDIPDDVDLAVIAIPAKVVPKVLEECGEKGVKAVVIISAGFREVGNYKLEMEIVEMCKRYGIKMVGPNCLGIVNTSNGLNATFSGVEPLRGKIALVSQSGALIIAMMDWAIANNIGFSKIVSLGNKAHLNESDFIEYLSKDEETEVIALYVEGIEEGGRFMEVAEKCRKPIVAIKSGKTSVGAKAVSSHTGSLAGSYEACRTAFKQCGVVEAESVEELFDFSTVLSYVKGFRGGVAIVTNSGGPAVMASDAVEKFDLNLASFERETVERLRSIAPHGNVYNPVDVLGDADAERFCRALDIVERDRNVGLILSILSPTATVDGVKVAERLVRSSKKVVGCFMGGKSFEKAVRILRENGIANFSDPVRAVKAVASVKFYGKKRRKEFVRFDVDVRKTRELLRRGLYFEVVRVYGIPVPPYGIARSAEEALEIADRIGYPVAMKVVSPKITHKTDVGCVKLNVKRCDVVKTFYEILKRAEEFGDVEGVMIQKMMPAGKEVIVGMKRDPSFGPLVMFGMGGIYVEVFRDVSFRIAPLSKEDAEDMVREVKAYRILQGVRGEKPSDVNAVVDVILRVSQIVTDLKEILELDINPIFVYEKGCCAVDVKVIV
ncbi:acetate--CoA ligase family protein [Archaeoglobus sp.]